MTEKQTYRFADGNQQTERVNRFELIIFAVFALCNFCIVFVAFVRGYQTAVFTAVTFAISIGAVIAMELTYRRSRQSETIRWMSLVALIILSFLMTWAFDVYYVRFAVAAPVAVYILYYDSKFIVTTVITTGLVQVITTIQKFVRTDCQISLLDISTATAVVIFYLVVVCLIERTGKMFRLDMLGSLRDEKEHQEKMMQDVIYVAAEVRKGTAGAMDIVNQLDESTGIVTGAVRDISDSSQSTAENIQNQTVMTQSIQDAIEKTLSRSESMVAIAQKAKELNDENLGIVKEIQNQSVTIAQTNGNVTATMQTLQERADAVKGIADTIFDISNQTNLLALNASIESARAGEAGRGFAVVADEIRQLAQSAEAAREQDGLIGSAVDTFGEMSENVAQLTQDIAEVDTMLTNLSEANNQIVDSITQLSATSEEVSAASAQAEGLSNKNLSNADNTKEILNQVLLVSKQLDQYVGTKEENTSEA